MSKISPPKEGRNMTEFKREPRYIVFKIKDLEAYCNTEAMVALQRIGDRVAEGRRDHGKPPFNAVVVEQDWPEFEPTWEAIEGRMTGKPIEPRYAIAIRIKELEAYQRNAGVWMAELIEKNDHLLHALQAISEMTDAEAEFEAAQVAREALNP